MQRSADLDDLDLDVVDTEVVNQEKEDDEDGLAPASYYLPQNRRPSRLSRMDSYRVRNILFLSILCPEKWLFYYVLQILTSVITFEGGPFLIKCGGIPAHDPGC